MVHTASTATVVVNTIRTFESELIGADHKTKRRHAAELKQSLDKLAGPPVAKARQVFWPAYVLGLFVGPLAGWALWRWAGEPYFLPSTEYSAFALLYVFAQAIERGIEPLTKHLERIPFLNKKQAKNDDEDQAIVHQAPVTANQDVVDQNRCVLLWSLASFVAMVLCGYAGVMMFRILAQAETVDIHPMVDIAITGLAIGAGTKPLHDLISYVQKSKEKK